MEIEVRPVGDPQLLAVTIANRDRAQQWCREDAPDRLLAAITRQRLDDEVCLPRLHGGAVANEHGAVVVLGESGAGKSTLIAHLAGSGFELVNDEQLTIYRDHGVVAGFTRPVAIKPGGAPFLPPGLEVDLASTAVQLLSAVDLGTRHRLTARPALVVLPDRTETRSTSDSGFECEVLGPAQAVEALIANSLDIANRPVAALEAFAWLASEVPVVRLRCHNSAVGAQAVRSLLEDLPLADDMAWAVHRPESSDYGPQALRCPGELTVSEDTRWVEIGEDVVVYHQETRSVTTLNRPGAALWRALPGSRVQLGIEASPEIREFVAELIENRLIEDKKSRSDQPNGGKA
ncbi:MAG: hypothetical protein V9F00_00130 [Nocardioides sp.]